MVGHRGALHSGLVLVTLELPMLRKCLAIGLFLAVPPCMSLAQEAAGTDAAVPASDAAGVEAGADLGQPFETRNAVFEPRPFTQMPGWGNDNFSDSVQGMRQSCAALKRKSVWDRVCASFAAVDHADTGSVRAFFEANFYAYQVMSPARVSTGKLTGYFEPLLEGSRVRDEKFRYPVYGLPNDLRLLDAGVARTGSVWLYEDGIRLRGGSAGDGRSREYEVDLQGMNAGVRDKRFRVRVEARRVVPYWSRQRIEQNALNAPVLAWVEDPHRLYSMQVQGSGKIRLKQGGLVRLAYAEQNGHPFRPRVNRGSSVDLALAGIKARGLVAGGSAGVSNVLPDPRLPDSVNDEVARMIAALQGNAPPPRPKAAPRPATTAAGRPAQMPSGQAARPVQAARAGAPAGNTSRSEVDAIIAALRGEGPPPPPRPVTGSSSPVAVASAPPAPRPGSSSAGTATSPIAGGTTGIPDPSYVFFRSIGDGPEGPVGALGVPLSAGRSLAVDPRTTPLGAPVFISTTQPGGEAPMQRLMFAQDTGGAIRGSVRGDFFWGFGDTAGRMALATNDNMQMWLLLPRQQTISAVAAKGMRLRGSVRELPDCVIAEPGFCVEDDYVD